MRSFLHDLDILEIAEAQMIAGNIIPAIITSTAFAAGSSLLELF